MREIKFRAWIERTTDHYIADPIDIAHKEFKELEPRNNTDEWDIWYSDREIRVDEIRDTMDINAKDRYEITLEMVPCGINDKGLTIRPHNCKVIDTICQYTGLKDKNGKEIYDGDICMGKRGGEPYKFTVKWDEVDARFLGYTQNGYICYVGQEPCVEVIDNIYENPDLLEVTHED